MTSQTNAPAPGTAPHDGVMTDLDQDPSDRELLISDPWQWWRSQMTVTHKWAYLDHAAVGPLSRPAGRALRRYATQAETEGDTVWPQWNGAVEALRKSFADWIRADHDEICLVPNTSTGINLVADGFPWKPGDSVVIPDGEFPSNQFPWQNQAHKGVNVRVAPRRNGEVTVDDLFEHVDSTTRIIALSWVGYASGFRADLESIVSRAHEQGVFVFVDAIQGMGMFDLDLSKVDIDFLAADGHKWLLGPEGFGVAMIRRRHLDRLRCNNVGWNSVRDSHNYQSPTFELRKTAVRFEPGSFNMAGAAALGASLGLFQQIRQQHGADAIENRVLDLVADLEQRLASIGLKTRLPDQRNNRSGIVTFDVGELDPVNVRKHALDRGCVVSCRGGGIRAGVHVYNDESDLQRLVDAVEDCTA